MVGVLSAEKATVKSELGTDGMAVESLSSPEESRARAHVWARRQSGMGSAPVPTSARLPSISVLFPAAPSGLVECLTSHCGFHARQTHMPGGSCLLPSANRLLSFTTLEHGKCQPLCGSLA